MTEMVDFDGRIIGFSGDTVSLEAHDANGGVHLASSDVVITGGRVQVCSDSRLLGLQEPHRVDTTSRPAADTLQSRCENGITVCIGGLLICAADFRVIGSCKGAWGAARIFTP